MQKQVRMKTEMKKIPQHNNREWHENRLASAVNNNRAQDSSNSRENTALRQIPRGRNSLNLLIKRFISSFSKTTNSERISISKDSRQRRRKGQVLRYAAASKLFPEGSLPPPPQHFAHWQLWRSPCPCPAAAAGEARGKQSRSPTARQGGRWCGDPEVSQSGLATRGQGRQSIPGTHGEGMEFVHWNLLSRTWKTIVYQLGVFCTAVLHVCIFT